MRVSAASLCEHHTLLKSLAGAALAACFLVLSATTLRGDEPAGKSAKGSDSDKPPEPTVVQVETKDGLQMELTYYASAKAKDAGKQVVPIVMLHGWKGSSADMAHLAFSLQALGHAVVVPDLRGHGKSTRTRNDGKPIDQALMKPADFNAMVTQDMEAVNKFLVEKNNAADLNIEKLCVVGADMGAVVAMNWAVKDWSVPDLLNGKQGKDVKALVLISPPLNFRGVSTSPALASPIIKTGLSMLVIVGGEKGAGKALEDAQRINKLLAAQRPKPPTDAEEWKKNPPDLFFQELKTTLQGAKILEDRKLGGQVSGLIADFIDLRLAGKRFPWAMRSDPLGH
jgi:pimeloyl-ACP methyl ester carboxylesterase